MLPRYASVYLRRDTAFCAFSVSRVFLSASCRAYLELRIHWQMIIVVFVKGNAKLDRGLYYFSPVSLNSSLIEVGKGGVILVNDMSPRERDTSIVIVSLQINL